MNNFNKEDYILKGKKNNHIWLCLGINAPSICSSYANAF